MRITKTLSAFKLNEAKAKKTYKEKIQEMSEKEFTEYAKKEHAKHQKSIKHSEDSIPYGEFYLELASIFGRKKK